VNGAGFDASDGQVHGDHVEVRNSMVHDVAVMHPAGARFAWRDRTQRCVFTGMQETQSIALQRNLGMEMRGLPGGIQRRLLH